LSIRRLRCKSFIRDPLLKDRIDKYPSFLVETAQIDPALEELKMATYCIDYLNMPLFQGTIEDATVMKGAYGFMEYAVSNWSRHVEVAAFLACGYHQVMAHLVESLDLFLDVHWRDPTIKLPVSQRTTDRLEFFGNSTNFSKLEQAITSTRKQLAFFGQIRQGEITLDLLEVVKEVRLVLENVIKTASVTNMKLHTSLVRMYGSRVFKCSRLSCQYFTVGFETDDDRDRHMDKHLRPLRCTDENCLGFTFGFAQEQQYSKHMKDYHPDQQTQFPTNQDIDQSVKRLRSPAPQSALEALGTAVVNPAVENPEPVPYYMREPKKQKPTEFECDHCGKIFKKRYNLQSHLAIHNTSRDFECETCGKDFARRSDLDRHSGIHTGSSAVVCNGCGKSFARADNLRAHHRSDMGSTCLLQLDTGNL
jgi:hypothetical protein